MSSFRFLCAVLLQCYILTMLKPCTTYQIDGGSSEAVDLNFMIQTTVHAKGDCRIHNSGFRRWWCRCINMWSFDLESSFVFLDGQIPYHTFFCNSLVRTCTVMVQIGARLQGSEMAPQSLLQHAVVTRTNWLISSMIGEETKCGGYTYPSNGWSSGSSWGALYWWKIP